MRARLALLSSLFLFVVPLSAQDFAGTYTTTNDAGTLVSLVLTRGADGVYTGSMSADDVAFELQGSLVDTLLVGSLTGTGVALYFAASVAGTQLAFFMMEPDAMGQPNVESATGFTMTKAGAPAPANPPAREVPRAVPSAPSAAPTAGPGMIGDEYAGYFFRAPAGWKHQPTEDGILLGHDVIAGPILVGTHTSSTLEALQAEAMQGVQDQAMTLMPVGMPQAFASNGLQGEYQGVLQGQRVTAYAIGLISPHGGGITILAIAETSQFGAEHKRAVQELAQSVAFRPPEVSPVAQEWDRELRGRKLKNIDSYYSGPAVEGGVGGGYSSETTIALCSNGEFGYWGSGQVGASGAGVSGYSGGSDGVQGRWQIVSRGASQSVLVLNGNDGSVREFALSWQDKLVHLNGNKFFRIENDVCR